MGLPHKFKDSQGLLITHFLACLFSFQNGKEDELNSIVSHTFSDFDHGTDLMFRFFGTTTDEAFKSITGMTKLKAYKLLKGNAEDEVNLTAENTAYTYIVRKVNRMLFDRTQNIVRLFCYLHECDRQNSLKINLIRQWEDYKIYSHCMHENKHPMATWPDHKLREIIAMYNQQVSK